LATIHFFRGFFGGALRRAGRKGSRLLVLPLRPGLELRTGALIAAARKLAVIADAVIRGGRA
jgi:hypothetical protein